MADCFIIKKGISENESGIRPIDNTGIPIGDVIVPNNVTSLSQKCFKSNTQITSVTLPNTLIQFDTDCFNGCISLNRISIPNNISIIPNNCFYNCKKLVNISLPNNLESIGSSAFYYCSALKTINIPITCTSINGQAFRYCTKLTNIIFEEGSKCAFGTNCFDHCSSLTNEHVPYILSHAKTISTGLFSYCTGLTEVEAKYSWHSMFSHCTNLIKAAILGGWSSKNTGNEIFYGCTALEEAQIQNNNIETIGTRVFYNCTSLKKVFLPSTIIADTSNSLTSTSSSYYIFYNCKALEEVQLGQDWNMSLRLDVSTNLTVDSMVAMFNSLKDLTDDTAKTLTLGSTNLAKLTDEQKAIAINKNWTLA